MSEKKDDFAVTLLLGACCVFFTAALVYFQEYKHNRSEIERLQQQAQQYEGYRSGVRDLAR